jgi:hypothetical protein
VKERKSSRASLSRRALTGHPFGSRPIAPRRRVGAPVCADLPTASPVEKVHPRASKRTAITCSEALSATSRGLVMKGSPGSSPGVGFPQMQVAKRLSASSRAPGDDRAGCDAVHATGSRRPAQRAGHPHRPRPWPGARPVGRLPGRARPAARWHGDARRRSRRVPVGRRAHELGGGAAPRRRPARHPAAGRRDGYARASRPRTSTSTSTCRREDHDIEDEVCRSNPHVRWVDLDRHGFLLIEVTPERVRGEWWFVESVRRPARGVELGAAWCAVRGLALAASRARFGPVRPG